MKMNLCTRYFYFLVYIIWFWWPSKQLSNTPLYINVGCIAICAVNMDGDIKGWIHLITLVWIVTYHRIMEDSLNLIFVLALWYG
jgi:hypothetical protein